jgi:hypothetical protein
VDVIDIRGFVIGFNSSRCAPNELDILRVIGKSDEHRCIIEVIVHHLQMLEICLDIYEVAMQEVIHHIGEGVILKALCGPGTL